MSARPPLVVVLGATAAGKTAIAEELARQRGGEIVSADAFAVYRGLDVGTAKPSPTTRTEVPYHLIDVADPTETFSAGRWAAEARAAVEDIAARGRLPIVCGGSGFYVSAMIDGLPPGEARDPELRSRLFAWAARAGPADAHRVLVANDPDAAARIPVGNLRYTLRALEVVLVTGARASQRVGGGDRWREKWRVVKVVVEPERADLYAKIENRVHRMLESGWDEEVRRLIQAGVPLESNAFGAIGYREVADWISGRAGRAETERKVVAASRRLAKRQRTWFARETDALRVRPEEALRSILDSLDRDRENGREMSG